MAATRVDACAPDSPPARSRWVGRLRRRVLGINPDEVSLERRGFRTDRVEAREGLERIGRTFVYGYHCALEEDDSEALAVRLGAVDMEHRGFAFEGAAMALHLMDRLTPWRRDRLSRFRLGLGEPHVYMVHVGVGWALARLRRGIERQLDRLDPLLRWLALDGYGFHEAYFHARECVERQDVPGSLRGYARRAFDQGLGRGLWFVEGAEPARVAARVQTFVPDRQSDLWSGVGLACAYAGGCEAGGLEFLARAAGSFRAELAQGAAFAAKARQKAGNPAAHTEEACRVLCGLSAADAARRTDETVLDLPADADVPAYEVWRRRLQRQFQVSGF